MAGKPKHCLLDGAGCGGDMGGDTGYRPSLTPLSGLFMYADMRLATPPWQVADGCPVKRLPNGDTDEARGEAESDSWRGLKCDISGGYVDRASFARKCYNWGW
jgi:hypothetical protein